MFNALIFLHTSYQGSGMRKGAIVKAPEFPTQCRSQAKNKLPLKLGFWYMSYFLSRRNRCLQLKNQGVLQGNLAR